MEPRGILALITARQEAALIFCLITDVRTRVAVQCSEAQGPGRQWCRSKLQKVCGRRVSAVFSPCRVSGCRGGGVEGWGFPLEYRPLPPPDQPTNLSRIRTKSCGHRGRRGGGEEGREGTLVRTQQDPIHSLRRQGGVPTSQEVAKEPADNYTSSPASFPRFYPCV